MPKFKPGDRVVMTEAAIRMGLASRRGYRGIVHQCVEEWAGDSVAWLLILHDGDSSPVWDFASFWQLDPAAIVGSREWLEARAMTAAFARE